METSDINACLAWLLDRTIWYFGTLRRLHVSLIYNISDMFVI